VAEPDRRISPGGAEPVHAGAVICPACREGHHEKCRGGNWCDCQHRTKQPVEPATGRPGE
jgi:hypothetical protein